MSSTIQQDLNDAQEAYLAQQPPPLKSTQQTSAEICENLVSDLVDRALVERRSSVFTFNDRKSSLNAGSTASSDSAATAQVRFQDSIVLADADSATIRGSVNDSDDLKFLEAIACEFRRRIQCKTVFAFGRKNPLCFTGADAVDCTLDILNSSACAPFLAGYGYSLGRSDVTSWDKSSACEVLYRLVNELWLFVPCAVQQRRGWSLKRSGSNEKLYRALVEVNDDRKSLYRLTKDALVAEEISGECFDEFVMWFTHVDYGIRRKVGRVAFWKAGKHDGVIARKTLFKWLDDHLGVKKSSEKNKILHLLLERHVLDKFHLLTSCYVFRQ